jgi:transcriptional regulator with XRE-family HTH domain
MTAAPAPAVAPQETLGERIARLLKQQGRRQADLAQACSVHVTSVNKWIRVDTIPRWQLLPSIASFFGLTLAELVNGTSSAQEAA